MRIKLEILSGRAVEGKSVLDFTRMTPNNFAVNPYVAISSGRLDGADYICGACSVVLAEGVLRGAIVGMVLRCPKCKSYNQLQGS
ncbi:hypothetical protein D3C77_537420 [compost metagenome]